MPHLIVKNRKVCVVNGKPVTSADGAPCVCDGGLCPELPDNIKVTLSGRFMLSHKVTRYPPGFEPTTETETHDAVFPQVEVTMARTSGGYESSIDCDIPMSGNASLVTDGFSPEFGGSGVLQRVTAISVRATPLDLSDPNSPCVLTTIAITCTGMYRRLGNTVYDPLTVVYTGQYHSLLSPVVGEHNAFGSSIYNPLPGERYLVAGANGLTANGGVFDGLCTSPPNYYDEGNAGQTPVNTETSCHAFSFRIEAYEGQPICDSNPFVKADRCDGTGSPITVDLRDAIPNEPSSPEYQSNLYRPNGDIAAAPADTNIWVPGLCQSPPEEYAVYERCDDPSDTILVDESGKPPSAVTALAGSLRYKPTPSTAEGTPTPVSWSTDSCPLGNDQLWERCRIDGEFYTPSGFLPPNRIRVSNEVTTSTTIRATIAGPYYQSGARQCQDFARVFYHLIPDDGGTYLTQGVGVPVPESCGATQDRYIRSLCSGSPSDPGDPVDPQDPAIRSRLPLVDLEGFDPSLEQRRMRQGGCCGQPSQGG